CALVRDAESSANGSLAIAEDIVGKANAGTEVVVIACTQRACRSKAARTADAFQLRNLRNLLGRECGRAIRGIVGRLNLRQQIVAGPGNKGSGEIVFLVMTSEQVPAQAEVESQLATYFPVILEENAHLEVPPVASVFSKEWGRSGIEAGAGCGTDAGIYAGILFSSSICGKEQRVEKFIRRTSHAEQAVFDVAAEISPDLDVVVSVADRNQIGVGVDVLLEELGITSVGAESSGAVIEDARKSDLRNTGDTSADLGIVLRVTGPELIEDGWRESMHPAELPAGKLIARRIRKSPRAGRIAGAELV